MATQNAVRVPPMEVEAGAPNRRDDEKMVAFMATHKAVEASEKQWLP